jgi:hypothetical protein
VKTTQSRVMGDLRLSYPLGVQCGDISHPHRNYTTTERSPGALDHTCDATADRRASTGHQTPP